MTAAERYKWLLANALERVCVLEEQLEFATQRVAELEHELEQRTPQNDKPEVGLHD